MLDLSAEPHERKGSSGNRTPAGPFCLFRGCFCWGLCPVPYAFVGGYIQRRRERAFAFEMKQRGRLIDWTDFQQMTDQDRGTLIVEWYSVKGPIRWWWTSDDIYALCPHPIVDWILKMRNDESYRPLADWCRQRYTDPDEGHALLVDCVPNRVHISPGKAIGPALFGMKWLEVVPPECLRDYKMSSGKIADS